MNKVGNWLEILATKFVLLLGFCMFLAFSFWAMKYKHELPSDLSSERVVGYLDNKGLNVLVMGIFFLIIVLLGKLVLRGEEAVVHRRVRNIVIGITVLSGILLSVWVSICHITPIWDQLQVYYGALEFHAGKYDLMDTYYNTYPQQYGLSFLYELFLWLNPGYRFFQYLNVIFIMTVLVFVYLIAEELFHRNEISFYAVICTVCFFPLPIYVNFVYGELWNMAFGIVAIWAVLRCLSTGKMRYGVVGIGMMSVAMVARINVVVWAIALALMLLVYAIRHKKMQMVVLSVLIVLVPILCVEGVKWSYELRSGKEIQPGAPYILTICMGMQERWEGPGYYSGYTNIVFNGPAERDKDVAIQIAMQDINARMQEFLADPGYARDFVQRKIWQQWNESTYNSLVMTCTFEQPPSGIVERVYYGDLQEVLCKWGNYYLFIIYFFVMVYAVVTLCKERRIEQGILIIALFGGLLFSIVWETKARYMFPYTILMFPCMAAGIYHVRFVFGKCLTILRERKRKVLENNGSME